MPDQQMGHAPQNNEQEFHQGQEQVYTWEHAKIQEEEELAHGFLLEEYGKEEDF